MAEVAAKLDARGLSCPLPIVRTSKALKALRPGEVLEVKTTDPGSLKDMAVYCEQYGHRLMASHDVSDGYIFYIEKS